MPEQSHLDEMNAAIRAQRERHAVPRTMVPEPPAQTDEQAPEPAPGPESSPRRGLLARLLRRS
ncbi:MAG TPA: hypothetical protein VFB35_02205 [Gaiellaceae bacterium]|nr:hypothetical protein [Gaiellaceae bacterium]